MSTTWYPAAPQPPSTKAVSEKELESISVLLIGKSGNGKSAVGNALLGEALFKVSTGVAKCTTRTESHQVTRTHNGHQFNLQVVDLPDLCHAMDEDTQREQLQLAADFTFPAPTVVCVVLRGDVRFTPAEYDIYRTTLQLLGRQLGWDGGKGGQRPPKKAKSPVRDGEGVMREEAAAFGNLMIAFTRGDALAVEEQDSFQDQLKQANEELQQVVQDAKDRWVLLNLPRQQQAASGSDAAGAAASPDNTRIHRLLDIAVRVHDQQKKNQAVPKPLRVVLVGSPGTGKSATGNTLLYPVSPPFSSRMGLSSDTRGRQTAVNPHVRGWTVEVTDTPAFSGNLSDAQGLKNYVRDCLAPDRPKDTTPYVLLLVLKACERFQQQDSLLISALINHVEGPQLLSRSMAVVFTGGDLVRKSGTSMENLLQHAPLELRDLLHSVNQRYVLVDNQTSSSASATERLLQRNRLLQAATSLSLPKTALGERGGGRGGIRGEGAGGRRGGPTVPGSNQRHGSLDHADLEAAERHVGIDANSPFRRSKSVPADRRKKGGNPRPANANPPMQGSAGPEDQKKASKGLCILS